MNNLFAIMNKRLSTKDTVKLGSHGRLGNTGVEMNDSSTISVKGGPTKLARKLSSRFLGTNLSNE